MRFSNVVTIGVAVTLSAAAARLWPLPAASASGPVPDFTEVIAAADAGVAHVTTTLAGDRAPGSRDDAVGGGFVVSAEGLVVTSRHVVSGAKRVMVTLAGRGTLDATVVGVDEALDVALLRVASVGLSVARIGDPRSLRVGEWVLAAGSPYHLAHSWSAGIVSGLHRSQVGVSLRGYEDFIQTDAAANVGNSGGPLVNVRGEVVGMVTAILSRTGVSQGVSLAVPIDAVMDAVRRLSGGGPAIPRPSLGAIVRESDSRAGGGGLEITRFQPGSVGEAAGLRVGDRIVEVDGQPTPMSADLQRILWAKPPGTAVTVVFLRGGQRFQVPVRLP